jgi:hypothetical protein
LTKNFFLFLLILLVFVALPAKAVFASTTEGTITGSAWSSQIGWINFGTTGGNTHIIDTTITGYAWNENTAWINLGATKSGVKNDGNGNLSGKAWAEGTGWINFSGVTINSSGVFSGTASGDNNININFSCAHCNVTTDWRPASSRTTTSTSSGGSGGGFAIGPPSAPFDVVINNGSQYTTTQTVTLSLTVRQDTVAMEISNVPDFANAVKEDYQATKLWTLTPGDGQKTVYVKFYNQYNVASLPISKNIILDTIPPTVKITSIKNVYSPDEEVIVGGTSEANSVITLFIDDRYGLFNTDQSGNWLITLGKLSLGTHSLQLFATDAAGNVGDRVTVQFSVQNGQPSSSQNPPPFTLAPPLTPILRQLSEGIRSLTPKFFQPLGRNLQQFVLAPPLAPIFQQFAEGVNSLLPKFFQPIAKSTPTPIAVVTVPKTAPFAFSGKFYYLSSNALSVFALAPLPSDVALLAQKFPQVQQTFNQVGVKKITDVQKLANANLNLPTLTSTLFPKTTITAEKLAVIKGIRVENLSPLAKSKIPSEVVFAKVGGGLLDLNVALSINNTNGGAEQTIETIAGRPLQLIVRVAQPVKKVIGYLAFKSKNYNQTALKVPLSNMTASLLFATPDFTGPIAQNTQISVEGANIQPSVEAQVVPQQSNYSSGVPTAGSTNSSSVEQRLILNQFEYADTGNGVYAATIQAPVVDAEYEIFTEIQYQDPILASKEIKLTTVVDPEGYVYEKNGDLETRIAGAITSLYWLNPATHDYELWPANNFQQENPQITDVTGKYSFLVPNGFYYLKVDAPGYLSYDGKPFEVTEGSGVHINIELKTQYWFLQIIDWKSLLLIVVILLLGYNFYKDRRRDKNKI